MQAKRRKIDKRTLPETIDEYYKAHLGSPAAVRRPKLLRRGNVWVALLGRNITDGIVGFGSTVEMALRAFDARYLSAFRPQVAA